MFDSVFWSILVWGGISTFLVMFILVAPFKWKWILEARHSIVFGHKGRQNKLLHTLKETFKNKACKKEREIARALNS